MLNFKLRAGMFCVLAGTCLLSCQNPAPGTPGASGNLAASNAFQALKQITVGKTPHGLGVAGGFAYNSNIGDSTISVIDTTTDRVVTTLSVPNGGVPGPVHAFPDGKQVLVLDTKRNGVIVIDPAQNHKMIQNFALPLTPSNLTIDDDNQSVFVTTTGNQAYLLTFDPDRSKAPTMKNFAVGASTAEGRSAGFSGDWGAVPSNGDNNVQLINMDTGAVTNVSDGNQPQPVAIGKADDKGVAVVVGNFSSSTITIYQLPDGTKTTLTNVGLSPTDIAVDADLHRAYLTMAGSNQVAVVDYLARTLVGLVPVGQRPVHIEEAPVLPGAMPTPAASAGKFNLLHNGAPTAPLSHEFWVGNDAGASVTVFAGDSLRVKATIATGNGHHKLAFGATKAYCSNITDNTVSVIDRAAIK